MKTTVLITAVLSLQVSALFAAIDNVPEMKANESNANYCVSLIPDVPSEAAFEEDAALADFVTLAPVIPLEAGFENEADDSTTPEADSLVPVIPTEAGFSDRLDLNTAENLSRYAPVIPAEAGFADTF
jgi:hypothetical protein